MIGPRAAKMKIAVLKLRMFNCHIYQKPELNIYNILTIVNSTSQHPDTFGRLMVFMLRAKEGDSLSKIRKMISALGLIPWGTVGFVRIFFRHPEEIVYFIYGRQDMSHDISLINYISAAENSVFSLPR